MKRKMMALLTTAAIGLSIFAAPGLTAEAAEGDVTFNGEVIDISGATELTQNNCGAGYLLSDGSTLVVTEYVYGGGVSGYPWYDSKDNITKVIIADSVTIVAGNGFNDYTNLTDVDFNDNMTELGGFNGCTGLTTLDIPESVTTLGGFNDCTGLTELNVPASVTVMQNFSECTNLARVVINSTSIDIGGTNGVFHGCTNLSDVNIPEGATKVNGFNETLLTSVVLPDSVKNVSGFENCTLLTNVIFPDTLEDIGIGSFQGCTGLTSVVLPDDLTFINRDIFNGCSNLAEITGGNNISSFTNRGAFHNLADTLTLTTSNVEFIEFMQNNYTGVNATNLRIIELDAEIAIGNETMTVTGSVDTRVVTLDVTIPVGGVQFTIDGDGKLTSQGIVVTSNTTVPLTVNVLSAEGQASGVDSEGVITNVAAPKLVPADFYTAEEWDNLGEYTTKQQIAIALKQVDVVDDGLGNLSAGEELTEATTDEAKVTTPVELGNISANSKLAHVLSGVQTAQNIGINIEKDKAFTNYGKEWLDADTNIFRYNVTLEFTY